MTDPVQRMTGLSVPEFAASYWGVAPLVKKAAQLPDGDFTDLLSRDDVDELLSRRGLRTPFVRMTIDGTVVPAARYTRGGGAGAEIADQVADDKVLAQFAAGATLVLQGLHRTWPPIQAFAQALVEQLGHPVQVNAYVTPPACAGLAPHYDVHDVFVVQFTGRKRWRIHAPVLDAPLRSQPWNDRKAAVAARAAETPLIDTVLECGDAMYLPRGYIHGAESLDDVSGHVTIGIHPVTRRALVDELFATLDGDADLRRALPAGLDLSDPAILKDELAATIAVLQAAIERIDAVAIARGIGRHVAASTRPAPLRPLQQFAATITLKPETRVRLRSGLRPILRSDGADVVVELPERMVRYANTAIESVRAATSGNAFAADALPGCDVAGGIALLTQLLRDGIVVPA